MNIQLEVLTEEPGGRYLRRYVYGAVRPGASGARIEGSADLPTGGTRFRVPAGTVRDRDVLRWAGQAFRVRAVRPLPPFRIEDEITADEARGTFDVVTEFAVSADGFALVSDGQALVA